MGKLYGESIWQSVKILKDIKDNECSIRIEDNGIIIRGRDNNGINIPADNMPSRMDPRDYAFDILCNEVLGELGKVVTENGSKWIKIGNEAKLEYTPNIPEKPEDELCKVIDMMAEEIEYPDYRGKTNADDFLYSATITKMEGGNSGLDANQIIQALLSATYCLDFGDLNSRIKTEIVPSKGKANEIAHRIYGYAMASGVAKYFMSPERTDHLHLILVFMILCVRK